MEPVFKAQDLSKLTLHFWLLHSAVFFLTPSSSQIKISCLQANIYSLFDDLGWYNLLIIHENYYPELIKVLYANLTAKDDVLFSRVNNIDIKMSCDDLADFLNIDNKSLDIFSESLSTFDDIPEDHSGEYASSQIHNDPNPSLFVNENMSLLAHISQVIAKIIVYDSAPSLNEFNHARGCTTFLICCILCFVPTNLPKLIFNIMTGPNLASDSLPFGILLTRLFKHWKIDLSNEVPTSHPPPIILVPFTRFTPEGKHWATQSLC